MNRISYLIMFLFVAASSPATDLEEAIERARRHAGESEYDYYKDVIQSRIKNAEEFRPGESWVLLEKSVFIEKRTKLMQVIPTLLLNTSLVQVQVSSIGRFDNHVFVSDDSVWFYNRNRKYEAYPEPLDIAYPISLMNNLLDSESRQQHTLQELMRFAETIFEIEPTINLILNNWIDVYIESNGVPPYQYLFDDIDTLTPEIAKEVEADWENLEDFKNEMPMKVRSAITAPESDTVNDQVVVTYYLLSNDYEIIKHDIIIRDNRFELSAVDSLGKYMAGFGD